MALFVGDVIWSRSGTPVKITGKNPLDGKITLDGDFDQIQQFSQNGIRNGLTEVEREQVNDSVKDFTETPSEYKKNIETLLEKITSMKKDKDVDKRVLSYLENELAYRIVSTRYTPEKYEISPNSLVTS